MSMMEYSLPIVDSESDLGIYNINFPASENIAMVLIPFSPGTNFRRHNLTSIDARFRFYGRSLH